MMYIISINYVKWCSFKSIIIWRHCIFLRYAIERSFSIHIKYAVCLIQYHFKCVNMNETDVWFVFFRRDFGNIFIRHIMVLWNAYQNVRAIQIHPNHLIKRQNNAILLNSRLPAQILICFIPHLTLCIWKSYDIYAIGLFMYECNDWLLPALFANVWTRVHVVRTYNTRKFANKHLQGWF